MFSALLALVTYGALFGPILVVVMIIISYLNDRNQAEIVFHRTVQEKLHLQKALREAELKQLHAQIKPHFLFNTLNTIRGFVMLGRPEEAMAVVDALAYSFRYSLRKSGLIVPLRDELKYLRSYLGIQEARFGGRLNVEMQGDESLAEAGVPYMSLQTLVENAVEHGGEKKLGPGRIAIRITPEGEDILCVVTDDGPGLHVKLDADLLLLPDDHFLLHGIGLSNVAERLKLHYPERATLRISSWPGHGCTVQMRWPRLPVPLEEEGGAP